MSALLVAPAMSAPRRHDPHHYAHPYPQARGRVACTVVSCLPIPPGFGATYGRTMGGTPTGYDVIICPPGVAPIR